MSRVGSGHGHSDVDDVLELGVGELPSREWTAININRFLHVVDGSLIVRSRS